MSETFGKALRRFRTRAGLTVSELAEALGASRHSIACWERDRRVPRDRARLLDLAQVLGLSGDETTQFTAAARTHLSHNDSFAQIPPAASPEECVVRDVGLHLPRCHQLRAPVADFIGRIAEIDQLSAVYQTGIAGGDLAMIIGVQGMGGIGKTELAYVIAHRLRDAFPDAQIVLNLRGSSAAPLTPAQVIQAIIHAFIPNAQLPDDLPTLEQYYRSVLHDRRALILADDARNAAQVQALIPPVGSVLMVTSRQRFTLPGMTTLDLEQLADGDAVALLRRICPRLQSTEAQVLAQLCGYLPLALRVSASLLRTVPALGVADYLTRLADTRQRLMHLRDPNDTQLDVSASLGASYMLLDTAAQQVFRQLGVLVADFTAELAQAVVVLPDGMSINGMLEQLLQRNLVLYDDERRRWQLHDLIRDLARSYLELAGELEATMWRYAGTVVQLAQTTQAQYLAGGDGIVAALTHFDAERPHVEAAYRWAAIHTATPHGDNLLLETILATTDIGELRSDAEGERIPQLDQALAAAQRLGQPAAAGRLLLSLGRARFDLGSFQQAIMTWEQALAIFRELGDRHSEGLTLGNLGTAYARLGTPLCAIAAYEQARDLFQALGDLRYKAHAVGNLGVAYADLETPRVAIPYLKDALAYARAEGDRRFESMLLHALGDVAYTLGSPGRACTACRDALTIAREIGDRQQEGYILITLGCALAAWGEHSRAIDTFDQALTILQDIRDGWGAATCRWHYGLILFEQGHRERSMPMLRTSSAYFVEIGHTQAAARTMLLAQLEVDEERSRRYPLKEQTVGGK